MRILAAKIFGKRQAQSTAAERSNDNPYTNAKRAWNDHTHGAIRDRDVGRVLSIAGALAVLMALGNSAYDRVQSTFIPYFVEVDKLGYARAVGAAESSKPTSPRIVQNAVESWIESLRMVTMDGSLQKKAILKVYAMINGKDPSFQKVNEFYNAGEGGPPFKRAETELVSTEITSTLPLSDSSWQVEWTETTRDLKGVMKGKVRWKAVVHVYHIPPNPRTTEEDLRLNPVGAYIRDFDWTRIQ